jgi:hypothetical protein
MMEGFMKGLTLGALAGAIYFLFATTGCQTVPYQGQAREVKKKPQTEGVIALALNHRDEDRQKADEKMKANCSPYAVQILEEGEVAIGETTSTSGKETDRKSTEKSMGKFLGMDIMSGEAGGKNTEASSTTTKVKEWQIAYKCDRKTSVKR